MVFLLLAQNVNTATWNNLWIDWENTGGFQSILKLGGEGKLRKLLKDVLVCQSLVVKCCVNFPDL